MKANELSNDSLFDYEFTPIRGSRIAQLGKKFIIVEFDTKSVILKDLDDFMEGTIGYRDLDELIVGDKIDIEDLRKMEIQSIIKSLEVHTNIIHERNEKVRQLINRLEKL